MEILGSFYIDSLTQLPNFFSFLECDFKKVFKDTGCFIQFDIDNFMNFNNKHGRDSGDLCLKLLVDSIKKVLLKEHNYSYFRNGGDEFLIVLPQAKYSLAKNVAASIKNEFKLKTLEYGFDYINLHILTLEYSKAITSIEEFYKLLFNNFLTNTNSSPDDKFNSDRLISHIIGGFVNRVKDSITSYNTAYNLALTDDTTGIANHRAGKKHLINLLHTFKECNKGFYILFIDGDNLRRYNTICYESGNEMIKNLSTVIKDSLPNECKLFRWLSGDEFVVVVEKNDYTYTSTLCETIRKNVESETMKWSYPITVSIGVSKFPEDGKDIKEVINKSEKANCYAKKCGKNRVIFWNNIEHM